MTNRWVMLNPGVCTYQPGPGIVARDCRNRIASQILPSFLHVTRVTYGMSVAAKVEYNVKKKHHRAVVVLRKVRTQILEYG